MDKVKIEALAGGIREGAHVLEEGDVKAVPLKVAERWCAAGWAKAVDGSIETGTPKPGVVTLDPADLEQSVN